MKWRCDTPRPLKRGILAILARYPMKTRQTLVILPSAMLSRKGIGIPYCATWGGISHWAAKSRSMWCSYVCPSLLFGWLWPRDDTLSTMSSRSCFVGDRYDWTTGAPHDGNEWRKYRIVPPAHPSRPLVYAYFNRSGSKGAFRLAGATWDHFRCTVEPSPGQIRCHVDLFDYKTAPSSAHILKKGLQLTPAIFLGASAGQPCASLERRADNNHQKRNRMFSLPNLRKSWKRKEIHTKKTRKCSQGGKKATTRIRGSGYDAHRCDWRCSDVGLEVHVFDLSPQQV